MNISRRAFLATSAALLATRAVRAQTNTAMTMNLSCGRIGVSVSQEDAIALAIKYGFQSVDPYPGYLANLDDDALGKLRDRMQFQNIQWACGGVPVDFRNDDATFKEGLKALPALAQTLQRAGVERTGTWLMFGSNDMTYREYGLLMAGRLREIAKVLADHNLRFGLE